MLVEVPRDLRCQMYFHHFGAPPPFFTSRHLNFHYPLKLAFTWAVDCSILRLQCSSDPILLLCGGGEWKVLCKIKKLTTVRNKLPELWILLREIWWWIICTNCSYCCANNELAILKEQRKRSKIMKKNVLKLVNSFLI